MTQLLKAFRDDEHGSMAIELVLVVPILTWVLLSTFVYFDVFRTESNTKRASLTVADMFSREQDLIDTSYMEGARKLLRTLTFAEADPDLRVTVYKYDLASDKYTVSWSRNIDMAPDLDNAAIAALRVKGRLPVMADGDTSILVETRTNYAAPFDTGIGPFTGGSDLGDLVFDTFTVMRPRFVSQLCWDAPDPQPDLC